MPYFVTAISMLRKKRLSKSKIISYTILMIVMFGGAGIIFIKTFYHKPASALPVGAQYPTASLVPQPSGAPQPNGFQQISGFSTMTGNPSPINESAQTASDSVSGARLDPAKIFQTKEFNDRESGTFINNIDQSAITTVDPFILNPIIRLQAIDPGTGRRVLLSWQKPSDVRVTSVEIYRTTVQGQIGDKIAQVDVSITSYSDNMVSRNTQYYYTVVPQAEDFISPTVSSFPVSIIPQDTLPPLLPKNIRVSQSSGGVTIDWDASMGATFYRLYRSMSRGKLGDQIADRVQTTTYIDKTVLPNTQYYYTVTALDEAQNESPTEYIIPQPGNPHPFGN